MFPSIPARPFSRSQGVLDAFVAVTENPHIPEEAASEVEVHVRGWLVDADGNAVVATWLDLSGYALAIPDGLRRDRPDVAQSLGLKDRSGASVGFEGSLRLPNDVPIGMHDARVIGRTLTGLGVYGVSSRRLRITEPPAPATVVREGLGSFDWRIRISDTQSGPRTLGRGAHTVRQESSLRISGRLEGAECMQVVATPLAGDAVTWRFACDANGNFDAALWTGGLERGLYRLAIAAIESDATATGVAWCEIDIAGPHHLPPLHLGRLRSAPDAGILHYADAAPRATPAAAATFVAGHPIGVGGWCLDPVAAAPVIAVYYQVDDLRPVPLSHHLPDPRDGAAGAVRCGFGGTIDSTRMEPGPHRVRILGAAASGAGWYVIDERTIDVLDNPRVRP